MTHIKRIAFITDIHLHEETPIIHGSDPARNWKLILEDVDKRALKAIVFGGDLGEKGAHQEFFESLKDYDLDLILGNHDQFKEVKLFYGAEITEGKNALFYAREDEYFKYIFLDSSIGSICDDQFEFLENNLQTDKRIIIFIHHPVLEIDTYVDKKYPLSNRDGILKLLNSCQNEITIFCGHYHLHDERTTGNIRQVVSPAASYQILKNAKKLETSGDTFGYTIITISDGIVSNELIML